MNRAKSSEAPITRIFVACIVGLLLAVALSVLCPKKYRADATVEIDSSRSITEVARVIQDENMLSKVIANAGLAKAWPASTREQIVERLQKTISANEIRNTTLVQISALDENPRLAADIANAVAGGFVDQQGKGGSRITIWEYADTPQTPVFPNLAFCLLAGLGAALAVWLISRSVARS